MPFDGADCRRMLPALADVGAVHVSSTGNRGAMQEAPEWFPHDSEGPDANSLQIVHDPDFWRRSSASPRAPLRSRRCRAQSESAVRAGHRRDAAGASARRLAHVAPHPGRLGLQPARSDRPRQRRRPAPGLVPRPARRRAAAGHAAGLRRRPLHAEPERRHPGHRRGHRGPALGVPAAAARRRLRAHHARRVHDQPQPRHLRRVDHRHQRRRVRLRPRRKDRRAGMGDSGARLPDPSGQSEHRADHRERQGHLRDGVACPRPDRTPAS